MPRITRQASTEPTDKEKLDALWAYIAEFKTLEQSGINAIKAKPKK